jgi:hypothetical protein
MIGIGAGYRHKNDVRDARMRTPPLFQRPSGRAVATADLGGREALLAALPPRRTVLALLVLVFFLAMIACFLTPPDFGIGILDRPTEVVNSSVRFFCTCQMQKMC